jgi:NADH-quinone oxidoreductase subunit F
MNSLEGKRGNHRIKPPFPRSPGVFAKPDDDQQRRDARGRAAHPEQRGGLVQAVDAAGQSRRAPERKLYSVCGNIQRPGNYEVPMGFRSKSSYTTFAAAHCLAGSFGRSSLAESPCRSRRSRKPKRASWTTRLRRPGHDARLGRSDFIDDAQNLVKQIARPRASSLTRAARSARNVVKAPRGRRRSSSGSWKARERRKTSTRCSRSPRT